MRIIYEPAGRAAEYAPLAVSLYRGCSHGCRYCFAPASTKTKIENFQNPYERKYALKLLEKDCIELQAQGDMREILLSFTTDPYQPLELTKELTRRAITLLIKYERKFTVLTKGGFVSLQDIDQMEKRPDLCRYGTTLVFSNPADRVQWEHLAASTEGRITALRVMKNHGIRTWVSLEPVVFPAQTLELIRWTHGIVDEYRIGKFNHYTDQNPALADLMTRTGYKYPTEDQWREFVREAKSILDLNGEKYKFKNDLLPYLRE